MTSIRLEDYMTVQEARAAIGCSPRAIWRAIARVGRERVVVEILGRTMVRKANLDEIKAHYYPYYSEAHQAMVREWGRRGGTQKGVNAKKAARRAGRKRAGGSGTSDAPA
jgi:hypothetical protein